MFNIYVYDGTIPQDDICYINAKEGLFIKKKVGVMESIIPVKNISFLPSLESTVKMNIPKIPGNVIAKVASFFKEVYNKHHAESIVVIFYNEQTKKYKIIPPKQEVSGAAVTYNKAMSIPDMLMIGTIHSHSNFSAFHSSVDDNDEKFFDGLHITIGNVNDEYPSISCSVVSNGFRCQTNAEEYISNIIVNPEVKTEVAPLYKSYRWSKEEGKLLEVVENNKTISVGTNRLDRRFILNVPEHKRQFNPEWMKMVSPKVYTPTQVSNQGWGGNYNREFWNDWHNYMGTGRIEKYSNNPLNVGPVKNGITFPRHDVTIEDTEEQLSDKSKHPCLSCPFKDYHIEELLEMVEDEDEAVFQCSKCKTIIEETDEEIICPKCNTDEFLEVIEVEKGLQIRDSKDEVIPTTESSVIDQSCYYKCEQCGNSFYRTESDEVCPFCYSSLYFTTEETLERQSIEDSGGKLTDEDINKIALLQAAKEEEYQEVIQQPIPEPNKPMPISERIRTMFKKTFGGAC